ncbi:SAM-dependent methyltransferase [Sphingomonas sp. QA11]|uniref:class I SAM-dependent methyltransferase n=1 Tax=Sphingomonas sp. QA11 TaxID=2950605 RepID=UPI00234B2CEE|nr:SAM-dependent methyltransferase [Sphingomonas sp. QA11]WCM25735.1 SAM-dependent methyltransferase [Sphingomonas sp. QA11]
MARIGGMWMPGAIPSGWNARRAARGVAETVRFLRALVARPSQVGAILPSGQALARLITSGVEPGAGVIELGPGTGVFTRALLARGVRERDLTLIESDPLFGRALRGAFPEARLLALDADRLGGFALPDAMPVGAVISGLPLLNMPRRKVFAIMRGAFVHLGAGGALYQFTYGRHCPVPRPILDRLGLKAVVVGRAVLNVPPATVYRISRRAPLRAGRHQAVRILTRGAA